MIRQLDADTPVTNICSAEDDGQSERRARHTQPASGVVRRGIQNCELLHVGHGASLTISVSPAAPRADGDSTGNDSSPKSPSRS